MPRHIPQPLSDDDFAVQTRNRDILVGAAGPVTVSYVKRDGSPSSSTGTVEFFNGKPGFDTGSVTIATDDKGNRTVNLHRITHITL